MFALVLSLCINFTSCNDYIIDSFDNENDCQEMLVLRSQSFALVWNDNKLLSHWLKPFNIRENVTLLHEYDFTCPFIPDSDMP
uniref:Uncharacterized protein n=1 Tax=Pseudomonas phage Pyxpy02 TaxID=3138547 RepID=A0AAU6VZP8_9VIRU